MSNWFRKVRSWTHDDLQVLFNGIVAVTAIAGMGGLVISSCLTYSGLVETRRATSLAERTSRVDQRAWLVFDFTGETVVPTVSKAFDASLPLKNLGKTPAFKAESLLLMTISPTLPPLNESDWTTSAVRNDLGVVFGAEPGRNMRMEWTTGTDDELTRFRNGQNLYARVRVNYCDAFGYRHRVERCAYYNVKDGTYVTNCGYTIDNHSGEGEPDKECTP